MIQKDKIEHIVACFSLVIIVGTFTCWWIGVITAIVFGLGKELWDQLTGRGNPDRYDLVADGIGTAIGTGILLLL